MSSPAVLLVEDDASLAELLVYHLQRAGYGVTHTTDGEEALLLAREHTPDLVLLDWMIPNLSGIEVCRQLRRTQATANVPIIMLTARGEEDDRVRGLETGADDYITKPFSPRELVARVGAVLRRVRPALAGELLSYADIEMDTAGHKVRRGGRAREPGTDRIPPVTPSPRASGHGVFARTAARCGVGPRKRYRGAYGRRAHSSFACRDQHGRSARHRPHGAIGRLRA